jgi:ribosomal protein L37AE/L43A
MYITFDYKCPSCQQFDTKFVRRDEMDLQKCEDCNVELVRLPAGTRTTFRFADTTLKD